MLGDLLFIDSADWHSHTHSRHSCLLEVWLGYLANILKKDYTPNCCHFLTSHLLINPHPSGCFPTIHSSDLCQVTNNLQGAKFNRVWFLEDSSPLSYLLVASSLLFETFSPKSYHPSVASFLIPTPATPSQNHLPGAHLQMLLSLRI